MEIRIITLPIQPSEEQQAELNKFLRSHKLVEIRKEIVVSGGVPFWTFCVTYVPAAANVQTSHRSQVDYRELLTEEEFVAYVRLREIRKEISDAKALPPFAVFTNEELANIAKLSMKEPLSSQSLQKVQGIGAKKAEKYGVELVEKFLSQNNADSVVPGDVPPVEEKENETDGLPF